MINNRKRIVSLVASTIICTQLGFLTNIHADIENHWGKESIEFVMSKKLIVGTPEGKFLPNNKVTRGMLVTILGRMEDQPMKYKESFDDVDANSYYANYVTWAVENGITKGMGDNKFVPNSNVTREQMATMLSKYIKNRGIELPKVNGELDFADQEQISSWAEESVAYVQQLGLIGGKPNNKFDPKGTTTRAEISTVVHKLIEAETKQKEKERQEALDKQKEKERQEALDKKKEKENQEALDKQKEKEKQEALDEQKEKERQEELDKQKEKERQEALDKQKELERQEEIEKEQQKDNSPHIKIIGASKEKITLNDIQNMNLITVKYTGRNKDFNNKRQEFTMTGVSIESFLNKIGANYRGKTLRVKASDGFTKRYDIDELLEGAYSFAENEKGSRVPAMIAISENGNYYNKSAGNPFRIITGQWDYDSDEEMDFNMQNWANYIEEMTIE